MYRYDLRFGALRLGPSWDKKSCVPNWQSHVFFSETRFESSCETEDMTRTPVSWLRRGQVRRGTAHYLATNGITRTQLDRFLDDVWFAAMEVN